MTIIVPLYEKPSGPSMAKEECANAESKAKPTPIRLPYTPISRLYASNGDYGCHVRDDCQWKFSIENPSDIERTETRSTQIGLTVTTGIEVATSLDVSTRYRNFIFCFYMNPHPLASHKEKYFSILETSDVSEVLGEYTVPPRSTLFVYKRQYAFRGKIWVRNREAHMPMQVIWGKDSLEAPYELSILADEQLLSTVPLRDQERVATVEDGWLLGHSPPEAHRYYEPFRGRLSDELWLLALLRDKYAWIFGPDGPPPTLTPVDH
ncbi:hypothetical protein BDW74DRAFT_179371 [Aspergillus multicolor]|uniref:uncharacterized protein n=1 Tax=Aspergillus multicolor TaxID=41759 RepID=UPI003CCE4D9F